MGDAMEKIRMGAYFQVAAVVSLTCNLASRAGDGRVPEDERDEMVKQLGQIEPLLKALHMPSAAGLVANTLKKIKSGEISWSEANGRWDSIRTVAREELGKVFVGFIPPHRSKYWRIEKPFGDPVYDNFPSARADATSAGDCLAVEQYEASVFHAMRVAEKGLRVLARERGIRKLRNAAIEWADWQTIVSALEDAAKQIKDTWTKGEKKDRATEFYRGAIGEIYAFKDEYRNYVMHARHSHDFPKAVVAHNRVCEFMQRLAVYLSED
jgi:hypothetical protein